MNTNITEYHAKYFAHELTKRSPSNSLEKLSSTLSNAQVDMNPHQIEAALFAFKSPLSKGAILADEVGLGKTIEAGLVLSQKWAERKRRLLLIVPSNLRKQWSLELQEKFFLPSIILENKTFNQFIREGNLNPFNQENLIIVCSYHFAKAKSSYIKQTPFDLVVIDEAHRLRNVYKTNNKIAREIKECIQNYPKILLTATPLQNSLLELFGLVSIIDDHVFGDLNSFKANYSRSSLEPSLFSNGKSTDMYTDLRERLKPVCIRTLRRQVLEYINYRDRKALTEDFIPSAQEIQLYDMISEYLQRPILYALPSSQRQLMTLVLRKLLASSSFAISSTLGGLITKLEKLEEEILKESETINDSLPLGIEENYESLSDTSDEWVDFDDDFEDDEKKKIKFTVDDLPNIKKEKEDLIKFRNLAKSIFKNSKGDALLKALSLGFQMTESLGANKKAVIFTESRITQEYLWGLLSENGYRDKILLFNGSNSDDKSKKIYSEWFEKNKDTDKVSGSKTADLRLALVDYFKSEAEIMIATEAAAEGINLQFCSLVINYDLPWNPQRIEQRIGRCHRYGQKHDVVVVNFVNRKNAADQRVYELLDEKFKLFKGVFGASDEVLGSIESGVDFEKRIASIYQTCRTEEEINKAFDDLQNEMDSSIQEGIKVAKEKLLENFDADVTEKFKINLKETKSYLETYEKWLWEITKFYLKENAIFSENDYSFSLRQNPFSNKDIEEGPYKIGKNIENAHVYRPGHPLAELILNDIKKLKLPNAEIVFDYSNYGQIISPIKELLGKTGTLKVSQLTSSSFESEDTIFITAITNDSNILDEDIAKKLFLLPSSLTYMNSSDTLDLEYLEIIEKEKINIHNRNILERNSEFFDDEIEKLDKWAEDKKKSMELDLKQLEIDIKSMKTTSKKILNLEEKIKIQREIKSLEKKRNEMRQRLFISQDEVDFKKDELLDKVESQLKQETKLDELFSLRFKII
jgi:ERCC4-related helicase